MSCPVCGHPTRKHDDGGCTLGHSGEACFCIMAPEEINPPDPQQVDPVDVERADAAEDLAAMVEAGLTFRPDQTVELVDDVEDPKTADVPAVPAVGQSIAVAFDGADFGTVVVVEEVTHDAERLALVVEQFDVSSVQFLGSTADLAGPPQPPAGVAAEPPAEAPPTVDEVAPPPSTELTASRPARPGRPRKARLAAPRRAGVRRTPPVPPPAAPANRPLHWWDSWHCEECFSRYFTPRVCCSREAIPVRVTVTRREVSGV